MKVNLKSTTTEEKLHTSGNDQWLKITCISKSLQLYSINKKNCRKRVGWFFDVCLFSALSARYGGTWMTRAEAYTVCLKPVKELSVDHGFVLSVFSVCCWLWRSI